MKKSQKKISLLIFTVVCLSVVFTVMVLFSIPKQNNKTEMKKETYYCEYQIQPGDTLDGIVSKLEKYNVNLSKKELKKSICEINGISNPDYIITYNYIIIPYTEMEIREMDN